MRVRSSPRQPGAKSLQMPEWKEPWRVFWGGRAAPRSETGLFPAWASFATLITLSLRVQLLSLSPCVALVTQRRGRRRIFIAIYSWKAEISRFRRTNDTKHELKLSLGKFRQSFSLLPLGEKTERIRTRERGCGCLYHAYRQLKMRIIE